MSNLKMYYIGNTNDIGNFIGSTPSFEGRFFYGTDGFFHDPLLKQYNNIKTPVSFPEGYSSLPYAYSNTTPFTWVNLARQEYVIYLGATGGDLHVGVYNFNGAIKRFLNFPRSMSYSDTQGAILFHNGVYYFACQDYSTSYQYVYSLDDTQGLVLAKAYTSSVGVVGVLKSGFVFAQSQGYYTFRTTLNYMLNPGVYTPAYDQYGRDLLAASDGGLSLGLFHGRVVLNNMGYSGAVTIPPNGVYSTSSNGGRGIIFYQGISFDLQFPIDYAGQLVYPIKLLHNGMPYMFVNSLISGYDIFASVLFEKFNPHYCDNFARGVPIAGTHR